MTDRSAEVDAITGGQPMPERPVQTCAIQARRRHQPDLGLPEGIVDHLLFDQDESHTGGALCGNIGVTFPMHRFEPIGDANRHALLKTSRCTAQTNATQPRLRRSKCRERSRHGTVDDSEQIAGHCRVGVEAEEHVARHHGVS